MQNAQKELTLKQKKFLRVYFETGNATKAALAAYDTTSANVASQIGSENLVKLRDVLTHRMEKEGLDLNWLVGKVKDAGEANKWNDFTGEKEPDHSTRLRAVDIAAKWLGIKDAPDTLQQFNIGEMKVNFE